MMAVAQVNSYPPDLSAYATTASLPAAVVANAPVQSVNGSTGAVSIPITTFAGGCTPAAPCTVAALMSAAPCSATYLAQYGVVSNLFSGASNTNEVMRCGVTGSTYYWRPQRTDFGATINGTGGSSTFTCLVSPPSIFTLGTLLSNQTWNLSTANCWPGASATITNGYTLGLFSATVTGLVGGATKLLGLGASGTFVYDGTAWRAQ